MYNLARTYGDATVNSAFKIHITQGIRVSIDIFAIREGIDETAFALSKLMPEATITILCLSAIKAVYENGVRLKLNDVKNIYSDLTEDEHRATMFKCSLKHIMV